MGKNVMVLLEEWVSIVFALVRLKVIRVVSGAFGTLMFGRCRLSLLVST